MTTTEITMERAIARLNLVCEAAAAVPASGLTAGLYAGPAGRRSRGRDDNIRAGTIVRHPKGYGIASADGRKVRDHDDDWRITVELRRPETAAEVAAVAACIARHWETETDFVAALDADDYRQQPERDALRSVRSRYVAALREPA